MIIKSGESGKMATGYKLLFSFAYIVLKKKWNKSAWVFIQSLKVFVYFHLKICRSVPPSHLANALDQQFSASIYMAA